MKVYKIVRRKGRHRISAVVDDYPWRTQYIPLQPTYPPHGSYLYAYKNKKDAERDFFFTGFQDFTFEAYELWEAEAEVIETPECFHAFWCVKGDIEKFWEAWHSPKRWELLKKYNIKYMENSGVFCKSITLKRCIKVKPHPYVKHFKKWLKKHGNKEEKELWMKIWEEEI